MGKSSKDKRDAYYRLAKEQNWRARSAFKLIQIDEQFDLFSHADPSQCVRVVDLCAAPGSWSQVLSRVLIKGESFGRRAWLEKMQREGLVSNATEASEKIDKSNAENGNGADDDDDDDLSQQTEANLNLTTNSPTSATALQPRTNVKIVAIDLQPMAPLEGITQLKADITHPSTVPLLLSALNPDSSTHELVDLVISDGAPDVTGLHDLDIYVQSQLLYAALSLAMKVLRPGGKFVAKIFRAKNVDLIYAQLKLVFERVHVAKPRSSRASSLEAFVVCEGFRPAGPGSGGEEDSEVGSGAPRWVAPFLATGDLDAYDADATYKLPADHVSLDPVQPPTAPPYRDAIERRRVEGGMYGKTKSRTRENT